MAPNPYAPPGAPTESPPASSDGFDEAMLARQQAVARVAAFQTRFLAAAALATILSGSLLYAAIREYILTRAGVHFAALTGALSYLPTFFVLLRLSRRIVALVVERRWPAWAAEAAQAHGVSVEAVLRHGRPLL